MKTLKELSDIRRSYAGAKYLMPSGENQADYRNSILDIAEELSDALHIAELTKHKVVRYNIEMAPEAAELVNELNTYLESAYEVVLELKKSLPDFYSEDVMYVERTITLD